MLAAGRDVSASFSNGFCLDSITHIEISCVLEAASDAKVLACFEQDYRSGMIVICSAPEKVALSGHAAEDHRKVSDYIASHLRNRELIDFYSAVGGVEPVALSALLDEEAKIANLSSCAHARWLDPAD